MKHYFILSFFFFISVANAVPHQGLEKKYNGRIVGGEQVPIEDFPYQVSLHYPDNYFFCGGSVISENHVLTAAHCMRFVPEGFVRAGSNKTQSGRTVHKIVQRMLHENYTESYDDMINDIAILTAEPAFEYGPSVAAIKLYDSMSEYMLEDGELTSVTGFGQIYENGPVSDGLMAVSLPIINNELCSKLYQDFRFGPILEDRFCAGYLEGGKDSCQGDSGGPVLIDGYQVGISSHGQGCARPKLPGIYTNVLHFLPWIEKTTHENNV